MHNWNEYTHQKLRELRLRASKKSGQNFLIHYKVINKILNSTTIDSNEHLLEIGGGLGILTHGLVNSNAKKVTVIERDKRLVKHLIKEYSEIDVIEDDAIRTKWPENVKIIANLPYSISTPLIDKIVHHSFSEAIIMVQKEVADRCIAKPGDRNYSRISILCNLHVTVEKLFNVSPESFFPEPKVYSTVIRLKPIDLVLSNDKNEIKLLARNLFSLRRRTTRAVLRGFLKRSELSPDCWDNSPHKDTRVSSLSVQKLDEILTHLKKHNAWPLA